MTDINLKMAPQRHVWSEPSEFKGRMGLFLALTEQSQQEQQITQYLELLPYLGGET